MPKADVKVIPNRNDIFELSLKDADVHNMVTAYQCGYFSWEQMLTILVLRLADREKLLFDRLVKAIQFECPNPDAHLRESAR